MGSKCSRKEHVLTQDVLLCRYIKNDIITWIVKIYESMKRGCILSAMKYFTYVDGKQCE